MTNNEITASLIKRELNKQSHCREKLEQSARRVIELRKKLKDAYPRFLDTCYSNSSNEFVYIEKFPTTEEIRSFYQYGGITKDNIPLYEYGWFDIKELAVIIKVLYSLKRQKEYQIITLTNFKIEHTGLETCDRELVSYMNFLIGLDKKINYLEEYNGKYFEPLGEGSLNYFEREILKPFNMDRHQNLVRLKQKGQKHDSSLGIKFDPFDKRYLFYHDSIISMSRFTTFSSKYNIFDNDIGDVIRSLDNESRKNIGGLLSFSLDFQDNFIAKVLFSIVIYKKKINKLVLDNDDYKYIFYELFKENIDISKIIDKEIPKVLTKHK